MNFKYYRKLNFMVKKKYLKENSFIIILFHKIFMTKYFNCIDMNTWLHHQSSNVIYANKNQQH